MPNLASAGYRTGYRCVWLSLLCLSACASDREHADVEQQASADGAAPSETDGAPSVEPDAGRAPGAQRLDASAESVITKDAAATGAGADAGDAAPQSDASSAPLRAFLNVNSMDLRSTDAESTHHNRVLANQRMAAELKTKGYHYRFVYAEGKDHCNQEVLKATLADALIWVWAGYPN